VDDALTYALNLRLLSPLSVSSSSDGAKYVIPSTRGERFSDQSLPGAGARFGFLAAHSRYSCTVRNVL
jgi:hypothetical protein